MAAAESGSEQPPQHRPEVGRPSDGPVGPQPTAGPDGDDSRYLDFEIEITTGVDGTYPLAVTRSPAGEAREAMVFPYDDISLERRLNSLRLALLRSGGPRRRATTPEEGEVRSFGQSMFDAMLVGQIRGLYDASYQLARQAGKGLRVKLRVLPPELACLPWEYLYDSHRAEFLSLSRDTPIVRFVESGRSIEPLRVTPPLRILGMVAGPSDLPALDTDRERRRVENAVSRLQADGLLELTWLEGQTWRDLQAAMRRGPWHVFHFIGHGGFDRNAGEGLIALCDDTNSSHSLSATQLGRLLADHHHLRLVLLNSCEGATGDRRDLFSSTAAVLVRRGLPAVLAMQDEITDQAAIEFARAFYEALADGYPVDAAVSEARKAVSLAVTNTLEWGTPVLFTRAADGVIFNMPPTASRDNATRSKEDGSRAERARALIDDLYTEALSAFWIEDWQRACTRLQDVLDLDPDHTEATSRLQEATRSLRRETLLAQVTEATDEANWKTAASTLEQILELDPDDGDAAAELAMVRTKARLGQLSAEASRLHDAGRWEAAINVITEIEELDPDHPDVKPLRKTAEEHLAVDPRLKRPNRSERAERPDPPAGGGHKSVETGGRSPTRRPKLVVGLVTAAVAAIGAVALALVATQFGSVPGGDTDGTDNDASDSPILAENFDGPTLDATTWQPFGVGGVEVATGTLNLTAGPGDGPTGVEGIDTYSIGDGLVIELPVLVRSAAPADQVVEVYVELVIGEQQASCFIPRSNINCWLGDNMLLTTAAEDSTPVDLALEIDPAHSALTVFVNGRPLGSGRLPDDAGDIVGPVRIGLDNRSTDDEASASVDHVIINRPDDATEGGG